jgi:hypothetical protein
MLDPEEFEFQTRAPEHFTTAFEEGGGTVLTVDEYLASLNPEFMIDWATPILGQQSAALQSAQDLLGTGQYLESLMAVRGGLKHLPQQTYPLRVLTGSAVQAIEVTANTWVTNLEFDGDGMLSWRTHGPPEGTAEVRVTLPKALAIAPFEVYVDGRPAVFTETSDPAVHHLEFALAQGPHRVTVHGASAMSGSR